MINEILAYWPQLLSSSMLTISLLLLAIVAGFSLAFVFTFCLQSKRWWLNLPVQLLTFFLRGTPLLVQIFLIYYGSSQFTWLRESVFWVAFKQPFVCAVIAFALNTAAYTCVLLRAAIHAVPANEVEAARALGMNNLLILRRIVLPRALRLVLPAYSNEVIMVLKGTSLASTITLLELMGMTRQIIAQTYDTLLFLLVAGVLYLLINAIIIGFFKLAERRWLLAWR